MATIHIHDDLDLSLQQAADALGRPKESFIEDLLSQHVEEYLEPVLTGAQIERMRESIAQLDRGDVITSEQVDAKFENLFRTLEARGKIEGQSIA